MKTYYFNTGVRPESRDGSPLFTGHVWRGGTMQIPFDCDDVPDNATFEFACDNPDLPEASRPGYIVREMHNTAMVSKYAYFRVPA